MKPNTIIQATTVLQSVLSAWQKMSITCLNFDIVAFVDNIQNSHRWFYYWAHIFHTDNEGKWLPKGVNSLQKWTIYVWRGRNEIKVTKNGNVHVIVVENIESRHRWIEGRMTCNRLKSAPSVPVLDVFSSSSSIVSL